MNTLPRIAIPQTDLSLSALCVGTSVFGTGLPIATTDLLYETFRQAGGNCFDTAHCYCFWLDTGAGASERALGDCIRRHGDSDKVHVITKGGHPSSEPKYSRPDGYLSPEVLASDIRESLQNLGMESVDLYFLHRDDTRVPVAEIVDALDVHIKAGRLRAIGVSNWSISRIAQANAWAQAHGRHAFVASQPQFNLARPNAPVATSDPEGRYLLDDDIAWHARTGLPVFAYSPTAAGYFASNGTRGLVAYDNPISRARLDRASQLAARLGVSAGQVALAYVMRQPFPVVAILGTASADHLLDAVDASQVALTDDDVRWLVDGIEAN